MQSYPILFRITHAVRCERFEALVTTEGRALMAFEDDEWWCHGVEPGGMTEHGDGPLVAYEAFRLSFRQAATLPSGSASMSSVRLPAVAAIIAKLTTVVVFPTPPFWLAIRSLCIDIPCLMIW